MKNNQETQKLNKTIIPIMLEFLPIKQVVYRSLKRAGIEEDSEAEWFLALALETNRANINFVKEISVKQLNVINKALKKRVKGMPLDKIFKNSQFYGNAFYVNTSVLSPRCETEILVEKAIELLKNNNSKNVLDLCTGSGAIAISIKKEVESANVYASDISLKALNIARKNAKLNGVKVDFRLSNLFKTLKKSIKYDMIVSNPPYIKSKEIKTLMPEVKKYDPTLALDGGRDGFKFYKNIIKAAPKHLNSQGTIMFEVGKGQAQVVKKMLEKDFENIEIINDYSQIERIVMATLKGKK